MQHMQQEPESRENIQRERDEWRDRTEKLQKELDIILLDTSEKDRHEKKSTDKLNEANRRLREKVSSLENELLSVRKSLQSATASPKSNENPRSEITKEDVEKHVDGAVTKVAADLHSVYKEKHETKVAAIKKSYASRWEKRVRDLEAKLSSAMKENSQLKMVQSETKPPAEVRSTGTPADGDELMEERATHSDEKHHETHVLEARVDDLTRELSDVNAHVEALRMELNIERVEKGELVATVEEWLSIQMPVEPGSEAPDHKSEHTKAPPPPQAQAQSEAQSDVPPGSPQDTHNLTIPSKRPSTSDSAQSSEGLSSHAGPPPTKKPVHSHEPHFIPNPASSQATRKPASTPRLPRLAAPRSIHHSGGASASRIKPPSPSISRVPSAGATPPFFSNRSGIMDSIEEMEPHAT